MDNDWLASYLFRDKLIITVHKAVDQNLVILENNSANDTVWRDTNSLQLPLVVAIIIHDLNVTGCFLSFWIRLILFHLACFIPNSTSTQSALLSHVVPI